MSRCRRLAVAALALSVLSARPSRAGASVSIGIELPGPPELVSVPGTPVLYAPAVSANFFFYGGQYYAFTGDAWYASPGYNGPWAIVAPEVVPRPILAVPVRYYRARPHAWRALRRESPPHWDPRWGRQWAEHGEPQQGGPHASRHEG